LSAVGDLQESHPPTPLAPAGEPAPARPGRETLRGLGVLLLLLLALVLFGVIGFLVALLVVALRPRPVARTHRHFIEAEALGLEPAPFDADAVVASEHRWALPAGVALALCDFAAVAVAHFLGGLLFTVVPGGAGSAGDVLLVDAQVARVLLLTPALLAVLFLTGRYGAVGRGGWRIGDAALFCGSALPLELGAAVSGLPPASMPVAVSSWLLAGCALPASLAVVRFLVRRGRFGAVPTLWVGDKDLIRSLAGAPGERAGAGDWRAPADEASLVVLRAALDRDEVARRIGRVVIALKGETVQRALELQRTLETSGVPLVMCVDLGMPGRFAQGARVELVNGVLQLETPMQARFQLRPHLKRLFDVIGALGGLLLVAPVMAVIAMLIRLDGGAVLFRHERVGRAGQSFQCLKLRNDPRIPRIGAFLRRTSLDELPQLVNVLRGEMSLVGPRPVVADELADYYRDSAELYRKVRPGITGPWQIGGRNDVSYAERVALDAHYALNWSLWTDLVIICRTLVVPFQREGAY
jgi:undecaprenyl-phosphate galactose phosphotransferase